MSATPAAMTTPAVVRRRRCAVGVAGVQPGRADGGERGDRGQDGGPHEVGRLLVVGERGGGGPANGAARLLVGEQRVGRQGLVLADPVENRPELALRRGVAALGGQRLRQVRVGGRAVAAVDRQVLRPVGGEGGIAPDQQDVRDLRVHVVEGEVQAGRRVDRRRVAVSDRLKLAAERAGRDGDHSGKAAGERHCCHRAVPDLGWRGHRLETTPMGGFVEARAVRVSLGHTRCLRAAIERPTYEPSVTPITHGAGSVRVV